MALCDVEFEASLPDLERSASQRTMKGTSRGMNLSEKHMEETGIWDGHRHGAGLSGRSSSTSVTRFSRMGFTLA